MRPMCRLGLVTVLSLGSASCSDPVPKRAPSDAGPTGPKADAATTTGDAGRAGPRCKRNDPLRSAFFGDLHVHTALSLDANLQGTRLRPAEAYRFARGEQVGLPPFDDQGRALRKLALERPLDFVALSDHAEFLGLVSTCLTPKSDGYDSEVCKSYREDPQNAFLPLNARLAAAPGDAQHDTPCTEANDFCGVAARSTWQEVQDAAALANDDSDACAFTSFVAYEWSASPSTKNLHRNVIFANDRVPEVPFSYFDGGEEEALWDALETQCIEAGKGCDVLTIPHNSNLSAGLMFEPLNRKGEAIDAEYAKRRSAFEPLVEIIQHKGASECLPEMGPDELCSFEVMPYNTLGSAAIGGLPNELVPADFVRDALAQGLGLGKTLGVNPFAYGFVGGTDTHLGIAGAVDEASFPGHGGAGSSAGKGPVGLVDQSWLNPGGLAVLWAEENSRESLFAAMRRREAYATSGPRIVLRFFGGPGLDAALCDSGELIAQGYARGVPMGGVLARSTAEKPPRFVVSALRDPGTKTTPGGKLERIQIVKGTFIDGKPRYRVIDVAGTAGISTLDTASCKSDGKGAAALCATFSDDDFDPDEPAFYYARVLEVPSCRWSARACVAAGVDCSIAASIGEGYEACCGDAPKSIQERAWSSPIFYAPE